MTDSTQTFNVREIEHATIPMADGTRLAARVWLPEGAESRPVPAILEYIPYRRRDFTRGRDETLHQYFAAHGYASVRVDLRGSGDSEGVLVDEYLQQELDDGVEVLRWIGEQPWCNGRVGMIGISWGGFNGLQIAALQPPELQAVVAVCASDDRYADDVHYMGGCLLGDNLSWASVMFAYNSLPPDPETYGDGWRERWLERLEGSGLWLETWLEHQRRDDYWRHASVCEDYSRVNCPVMAVSGWADGYTNAVFRQLENLSGPRQGLIGPWSHLYPHQGFPGPAIAFKEEVLRWWDHWLKGQETGIDGEPMLRAYIQESVEPSTRHHHRPGRWVSEPHWPSPNVTGRSFALGGGNRLSDQGDVEAKAVTVQSPLSVGLFAGKWCSYAAGPDMPHDQREEEGGSLVFETDPLEEPLELLGAPELELELEADRPVAMVAARLSDVVPNGKATRVTYGLLNLTHRNGHDKPEPLEPGRRYRVKLPLNHLGHVFSKGHVIRLGLSTSYFPLAWSPPEPVRLTVHTGGSRLTLPVRSPRTEADAAAELPTIDPEPSATPTTQLAAGDQRWTVRRDLGTNASELEVIKDAGRYRLEDVNLTVTNRTVEHYGYVDDDFDSVYGEVVADRSLERDDWSVRTRTRTVLRSDADHFHLHAELDAWDGEKRIYSRNWQRSIPRDHV